MDNKNYYSNLAVSSAPHLVTNLDTQKTMLMVLIALVPSFAVSIYVFGWNVIVLTLVCIAASMFFEWAYNKLLHRPQTVGDLSAAVGYSHSIQRAVQLPLLDGNHRLLRCNRNR